GDVMSLTAPRAINLSSGSGRRRDSPRRAAYVADNGIQLVGGGFACSTSAAEVRGVGVEVERQAVLVGDEVEIVGELQHFRVEVRASANAGAERSHVGTGRQQVVENALHLISPVILRHPQRCGLKHRQLLLETSQ